MSKLSFASQTFFDKDGEGWHIGVARKWRGDKAELFLLHDDEFTLEKLQKDASRLYKLFKEREEIQNKK